MNRSTRVAVVVIAVAAAIAAFFGGRFGPAFLLVLAASLACTAAVLHRPSAGLWILLVFMHYGVAFQDMPTLPRVVRYLLPVMILTSWALHVVVRRAEIRLPGWLAGWFAVYLFWMAFTALFSRYVGLGLAETLRFTLLGLTVLAAWNLWTRVDAGRALVAYALALLPVAVVGIGQFLSEGPAQILYRQGLQPERLASIYHNANTYGEFMAHAMIILTAVLLVPRGSLRFRSVVERLLLLACVMLFLAAMLVSFSRGSYVYAGSAVLVLVSAHRRFRWVVWSGIAAAAGYLVFFPLPTFLFYALRLGAGSSLRGALWSAGVQAALDHPWTGVGPGPGVFAAYRSYYLDTVAKRALAIDPGVVPGGGAHNVYLNSAAKMGWIGFLIVLALFILLWIRIPRAIRAYRRGDWVAGMAAAGVVGLSVHGMFEIGATLGVGFVSESLHFFLFGLILMSLERRMGPAQATPGNGVRAAVAVQQRPRLSGEARNDRDPGTRRSFGPLGKARTEKTPPTRQEYRRSGRQHRLRF